MAQVLALSEKGVLDATDEVGQACHYYLEAAASTGAEGVDSTFSVLFMQALEDAKHKQVLDFDPNRDFSGDPKLADLLASWATKASNALGKPLNANPNPNPNWRPPTLLGSR